MKVRELRCQRIAVQSRLALTSNVWGAHTNNAVTASVCALSVRRARRRGNRSITFHTQIVPIVDPVNSVRESPHAQHVTSALSQSSWIHIDWNTTLLYTQFAFLYIVSTVNDSCCKRLYIQQFVLKKRKMHEICRHSLLSISPLLWSFNWESTPNAFRQSTQNMEKNPVTHRKKLEQLQV